HNDPPDHSFRGMVTDAQFDGVPVTEKVMDYDDYVLKRGYYEANKPFADPANWLKDFDAAGAGHRPDRLEGDERGHRHRLAERLAECLEPDAADAGHHPECKGSKDRS
ncbi:MAG: hypothetical protein WAT25_03740, partial [Paracoccaceae bacterium]